MESKDLEACFKGKKLYGDDFTFEQILQWFRDEEEGFANLVAKERSAYQYEYHVLNRAHGFRYLDQEKFLHVLSIGGAYGDELEPILSRVERITILDPSTAFVVREKNGVPVDYVRPQPNGIMPFDDQVFDLVTCFSCLHHIPNVSTVIEELLRCLKPEGFALIREPIISMGDWRKPRTGLTSRERGIPLPLFRNMLVSAGFAILKETLCCFSLTPRIRPIIREHEYSSPIIVLLDQALCRLFAWNYVYHPVTPFQKLLPTAVSYVLRKTNVTTASSSRRI